MRFNEWLQQRDPDLVEFGIKRQLGRLAVVGLPMVTGAAGLALGGLGGGAVLGPGGAIGGGIAGYLGGKKAGEEASKKWFPQGTLDAMKKMKKK